MSNLGLASYALGYNGRAYTNPNDNYQAPYTIVAYTDCRSGLRHFLWNYYKSSSQRFINEGTETLDAQA
jgi:hypothetical protein